MQFQTLIFSLLAFTTLAIAAPLGPRGEATVDHPDTTEQLSALDWATKAARDVDATHASARRDVTDEPISFEEAMRILGYKGPFPVTDHKA